MNSTGERNNRSVWIKRGSDLEASDLCMAATKEVMIGKRTEVIIEGEISMVSSGNYGGSKAWIKQEAEVTAGSLNMTGYKATLDKKANVTVSDNFHMEAADIKKCAVKGSYSATTTSGNCLD